MRDTIYANKNLGQHFLKDQSVIDKIVRDHADKADVIVEIGPGKGALTQKLALHNKPLFLIEKDKRFIEHLESYTLKERIVLADALGFNWTQFIDENQLHDQKIWLVSNLPYNISALLFIEFLKTARISFMTLMFQKEVGDKTYYREHSKNQASSLLCMSKTFMNSTPLVKVLPGAFHPPPKVDSVVVSYQRIENPTIPFEQIREFEAFVKILFSLKRKQLGTVLKSHLSFATLEHLSKVIDLKRRAETLAMKEVYEIFHSYYHNS